MTSRLQCLSFLTILLVITICSSKPALQDGDSQIRNNNWELCAICGIPARVVLNTSPGPTLVPRRHIYLFIEGPDFTENNLRKAFERLSSAYPDPIFLTITAFSNKQFLEQLIEVEEKDSVADYADTPEGRKAQQKHDSTLYPPKSGYFRAYYLRSATNQEGFQYTPNPKDQKTIQVVLRSGRNM